MRYTKQIITKLLEDKTTDNDFINQLRGLAILANDEIGSNSGANAGYASPASSGVQNGGSDEEIISWFISAIWEATAFSIEEDYINTIDVQKWIECYYKKGLTPYQAMIEHNSVYK
jgi:hypothetical protein